MSNQILSGFPHRLIYGETLYSWIVRGLSRDRFVRPQRFHPVIGMVKPWQSFSGFTDSWKEQDFFDFEFDLTGPLISILNSEYHFDFAIFDRYYSSIKQPLTNFHYRLLCCRRCFRESMQQYNYPIWNKAWCYATAAVCQLHGSFLMKKDFDNSTHDRIWGSYLHALEWHRPDPGVSERLFAVLALKVQNWFQQKFIEQYSGGDALFFLYGLLLSKRTVFSPEGLAASRSGQRFSSICRIKLSLQDRISYGIDDSDAFQRGRALIIIGWLSGLISDKSVTKLVATSRHAHALFPPSLSPESLGRMVMRIVNAEEGEQVLTLLESLQDLNNPRVEAFLRGASSALKAFSRVGRPSIRHRPSL